jgi:hypothetical protein
VPANISIQPSIPLHPLVLGLGNFRRRRAGVDWTSNRKVDPAGLPRRDDFTNSIGKMPRGFARCAFLVHASLICMFELIELPMA